MMHTERAILSRSEPQTLKRRVEMTTRWIGPDDTLTVGQVGFLVRRHHNLNGWTRYELRDHPAKTNMSFEPRLYGWCGSNYDISTDAEGMASVEKVAKNGRAYVRELEGDELVAALEELGYPELGD